MEFVIYNSVEDTNHIREMISNKFLHLCTFKTPIIYTFSLDFSEFYSLEYIFHFYYKHLPKCSYQSI